jgi:hypothetical protein
MNSHLDYKNGTLGLTGTADEIRIVLTAIFDAPDVLEKLDQILENQETMMATSTETNARIDAINANTSRTAVAVVAVKAILVDLRGKIATGGMTADEEAAMLIRLDAAIGTTGEVATNLEQTAAGETEPPPVEPPVEPIPGS